MTALVVSEGQQVSHVVDVLTVEFSGVVPPARVVEAVDRAYRDLHETSTVPNFIPILALRRARTSLQTEARAAS